MKTQAHQAISLKTDHLTDHGWKDIFKGAATTVLTSYPNDPLHEHYRRLTTAGTKPNLAKLTLARRIAAVVLRMWKDGKEYNPETLRAKQQQEIASPAS